VRAFQTNIDLSASDLSQFQFLGSATSPQIGWAWELLCGGLACPTDLRLCRTRKGYRSR